MVDAPLWRRTLGPPYRRLRSLLGRLRPARIAALVAWSSGVVRSIQARRREPRFTVAVDVSPYWEPLTGVGWYLDRVLRSLADRDDLRLRLYGEDMVAAPGVPGPASPLPTGRAIEAVRYPLREDSSLPPGLAARLLLRLRPLLIAADGNRVMFAPNFYPPRRFEPALGLGRTSLVATVHDLAFRHVPWAVGDETLELLSRHLARTLREATRIVTPSEAVRGELVRAGLAPPERVRAIHHGSGQLAGEGPARAPSWAPDLYGLFVGTVEPRKNLETLIRAWRMLRRRLDRPPALVICGRFGWKDDRLRREVEAGAREGWLHHPGYVANEELAALFRGAFCLAFPSHYEGFGLPVLEAFAAGTPVVASDLPVLREVAGDAALYAPPDRPDAWVRQLERLLRDPEVAGQLVAAGRERAARFSWQRSAESHAEVFREVAERAG